MLTGLRLVLRDRLYRAFFLVLLLEGIAAGSVLPFVPLWADDVLGADEVQIGLLRTIAGMVAVVYSLVFGAFTDRTRRRTRWIVVTLGVTAIAWLALAGTSTYSLAALLYAMTGVGAFGLIFALLGDWLRYRQSDGAMLISNVVRLAYAIGWVIGPALAGVIIGQYGYTVLFVGTATAQALSFLYAWRTLRDVPSNPEHVVPAKPSPVAKEAGVSLGFAVYLPLTLFTAAMFCSFAAEPSRFVLLPLYLKDELASSVEQVGLLFSIGVAFELPLFLLAGRLADRYGAGRLLLIGLVSQGVYFGGLMIANSYWQIVALEPLFAVTIATVNGIGMLYVQSLLPQRAGTALAFYTVAFQLGPVVTAPLLGYIASRYGLTGAFAVSTGLALVSAVAFLISERRRVPIPQVEAAGRLAVPGERTR